MQTIYITIERDRESRSSHDGARFRVRAHVQPGSPALLVSTRALQSVTRAKTEAEALFGVLDWQEGKDDIRVSAFLEIE